MPIAYCLASYQLAVGGYAEALHPGADWHVYYSDVSQSVGVEASPFANSLLRKANPPFSDLLC